MDLATTGGRWSDIKSPGGDAAAKAAFKVLTNSSDGDVNKKLNWDSCSGDKRSTCFPIA